MQRSANCAPNSPRTNTRPPRLARQVRRSSQARRRGSALADPAPTTPKGSRTHPSTFPDGGVLDFHGVYRADSKSARYHRVMYPHHTHGMPLEHVFFQDPQSGVIITSSRAQFGGTMYPISGITAVSPIRIPAKRGAGIALAFIGASSLAFGVSAGGEGAAFVLMGLLMTIAGVFIVASAKPLFIVRLATAGGQVDALSTRDERAAVAVLNALQHAVASRR